MRIVVDSSAIAAILFDEPERDSFIAKLLRCQPIMSIVTFVELSAVARARLGVAALEEVDRQIREYGFEIASVSAVDLPILRQAMVDFGKGRGRPPAVLNFGDLFAYALAKRLDLPLLFKGDDFARTDVRPVIL